MFGNANTAGFTDLKSYDSNGDGVINASDSQFGLLRLWNDKNANGKVDAGELTTLAQQLWGIFYQNYLPVNDNGIDSQFLLVNIA